jgi:hypothetical protein
MLIYLEPRLGSHRHPVAGYSACQSYVSDFTSRFKIQPSADVLARVFKTASHKERNADTKHLDASLSVSHLLLKRLA